MHGPFMEHHAGCKLAGEHHCVKIRPDGRLDPGCRCPCCIDRQLQSLSASVRKGEDPPGEVICRFTGPEGSTYVLERGTPCGGRIH